MAKKKLKKILKNLAKVGTLGALAYGATKLGRKRATDAPGDAAAAAKKLLTSDAAYTGKGYDDHITRAAKLTEPKKWKMPLDPGRHVYPNVPFKGGGIAKRGTGAAFKKGGRVKSMGIAKRGGGVAKR